MEERLEFNAINVGVLGYITLTTLTNANPALRFVIREVGVMKGIGNWTVAAIIAVGTNATANNLLPNGNMTTIPLRGRNETEPSIWAANSGTQIRLRVLTAGAVAVGTPLVDVYVLGRWQNITAA